MSFQSRTRAAVALVMLALVVSAVPVLAQTPPKPAPPSGQTVRVTGVVRDEANAITLPGVPVEVLGTNEVVYTDVDGRYVVQLPPGTYQLKVLMDGYQEKLINVTAAEERLVNVDVGLTMASFSETVTVTAEAIDVTTSSAEAQLIERRNAD